MTTKPKKEMSNPVGRPAIWPRMLKAKRKGKALKLGPYANRRSAISTSCNFNAAMREAGVKTKYRFRARGLYVVMRKRKRAVED